MDNLQFSSKLTEAVYKASSAVADLLSLIDQSSIGIFEDDIIESINSTSPKTITALSAEDKHSKRVDEATKMLTRALSIIHYLSKIYEHSPDSVKLNDSAVETIGKTIDLTRLDFTSFQGYYNMAKSNDSFYTNFPDLKKSVIWFFEKYLEFANEANRLIENYNKDHPHKKIRSPQGYSSLPL